MNVSGRHRKPVRGRPTRPVRGAPGLEGSWPATGHAGGPSRQDLSSSKALGEQRFLWEPRPGDMETCRGTRCLRGGPGMSQEQGRMCPPFPARAVPTGTSTGPQCAFRDLPAPSPVLSAPAHPRAASQSQTLSQIPHLAWPRVQRQPSGHLGPARWASWRRQSKTNILVESGCDRRGHQNNTASRNHKTTVPSIPQIC